MTRPHGTIRQSQVVTTFGPGAMVDLPRHSVVIGGLDDWSFGEGRREIFEARLVAKLESLLDIRGLQLVVPPAESNDPRAPHAGITAWQFPEWFVAQYEERDGARARPLVHRQGLVNGEYQAPGGKKFPVVPVRFVQACLNGHLSDIDWHRFVHDEARDPCQRPLWLREKSATGDLGDVVVACECGRSRPMIVAARPDQTALGFCNGRRPWLGSQASEPCGGPDGPRLPNRLLLRHASDAYFSQTLRVISIPDQEAQFREAVAAIWDDHLAHLEDVADVKRERRSPKVKAALEGASDEKVWAEIQRRRGQAAAPTKSIKQAEVETLMDSKLEIGDDVPEGADFYARRTETPDQPLLASVDRIILVHRLREVTALLGFTRFEPALADIEGELTLDVRRAELARHVTWLPAVENRGEGVFIAFKPDALRTWIDRPAVKSRAEALNAGFESWRKRHGIKDTFRFPGVTYVMLHSLAHLLITAVSLECGYSASSIRERVYASDAGYGILLYTGTPDAEGTLGGLVGVGRKIAGHLRSALRLGLLCANDPVCAQHGPNDPHEERFLQGASCHGCLLIAEPSCERRNEFLDRSLVVPTVEGLGAEFFALGPA